MALLLPLLPPLLLLPLLPLLLLLLLLHSCVVTASSAPSTALLTKRSVAAYSQAPAPFDARGAAQLALFSAAAYCARADVSEWACAPCRALPHAARVRYIANTTSDVTAFVAAQASGGGIVIAFKGTNPEDINNLLLDLDWALAAAHYAGCELCAVHEGFYGGWTQLAPAILAALDELTGGAPGTEPITLTGHSLGGALATLAAYELTLAGFRVERVTSFGAPRVGNEAFAASFHALVNQGDAKAASLTLSRALGTPATAAVAAAAPAGVAAAAVRTSTQQRTPSRRRLTRLRNGLRAISPSASAGVAPSVALRRAAGLAGCTPLAARCARLPALTSSRAGALTAGSAAGAAAAAADAALLGAGAVRVVHDADIVAHLPPRVFGYAHAPQEVWVRACGEWGPAAANVTQGGCTGGGAGAAALGWRVCSPGEGEDSSCSRSWVPSLADHLVYMGINISRLC